MIRVECISQLEITADKVFSQEDFEGIEKYINFSNKNLFSPTFVFLANTFYNKSSFLTFNTQFKSLNDEFKKPFLYWYKVSIFYSFLNLFFPALINGAKRLIYFNPYYYLLNIGRKYFVSSDSILSADTFNEYYPDYYSSPEKYTHILVDSSTKIPVKIVDEYKFQISPVLVKNKDKSYTFYYVPSSIYLDKERFFNFTYKRRTNFHASLHYYNLAVDFIVLPANLDNIDVSSILAEIVEFKNQAEKAILGLDVKLWYKLLETQSQLTENDFPGKVSYKLCYLADNIIHTQISNIPSVILDRIMSIVSSMDDLSCLH